MTRPAVLVLALTPLLTTPALGQTAAVSDADPIMESMRPHHERVRDYLTRAAEQMPEEQYSFRPSPEVRSFGEILAHIADAQYYFCASALGESSPAPADIEETHTTKAAIVAILQRSFEYCERAYDLAGAEASRPVEVGGRRRVPLSSLILNIGHNNEHYGNLVTYMRIQGLVPPSSQPRG